VVKQTEQLIANASTWSVDFQRITGTEIQVRVSWGKEGKKHQDVTIALDDKDGAKYKCCGMEKEYQRPCIHVAIVLHTAAKNHHQGEHWSVFDHRFYGEVWLTITWLNQMRPLPIACDTLIAQLDQDETKHTWREKPKVRDEQIAPIRYSHLCLFVQFGCPKEPERKPLVKGRAYKTCQGCGEKGHNISSCIAVDLDLYYTNLTSSDPAFVGDGSDIEEGSESESQDGEQELEDGEEAELLLEADNPPPPPIQTRARNYQEIEQGGQLPPRRPRRQ